MSENVFIFILERKLKKRKRLPVVLWHFACLSFDGAASTLQSSWSSSRIPKSGVRSYMEKSRWNSAGACFSRALLPLRSTQNGSFVSERPKNLFGICCLATPCGWLCLLFRTFLYPSFLPALIMSCLLNCQLTGARLSTSALEVHHLVLSKGKTKGLYL